MPSVENIVNATSAAIEKRDKTGKDDTSKWLEELLGDMSKRSATKEIAIGAATGWLAGFLAVKVGRVAAIAVGGGIVVLQIANHKGYVKIEWDKILRTADKVADKIEEKVTGKEASTVDKLGRYVDRKLDQAERYVDRHLDRVDNKGRRWFGAFINNGRKRGYELQELHLFLVSFAASFAIGIASG